MICYNRLAEVYDKLIYEDIDYNDIGRFIMEEMNSLGVEKDKYLDLACGTGNLTEVLGKSFKFTYGIDLSQDMLCKAEDKLRDLKIKNKLLCMDITDFSLNEKVNLVTSCLDSTNYILEEEGLEGYFRCVNDVMEENGIFVFDINSEYKLREVLGNNSYTYDEEDVFYVWENELEDECVQMFLTFFIKNGDTYERFDENHIERIYSTGMIEEKLYQCGFDLIKITDNYSCNEVEGDSERITFVARKMRRKQDER